VWFERGAVRLAALGVLRFGVEDRLSARKQRVGLGMRTGRVARVLLHLFQVLLGLLLVPASALLQRMVVFSVFELVHDIGLFGDCVGAVEGLCKDVLVVDLFHSLEVEIEAVSAELLVSVERNEFVHQAERERRALGIVRALLVGIPVSPVALRLTGSVVRIAGFDVAMRAVAVRLVGHQVPLLLISHCRRFVGIARFL